MVIFGLTICGPLIGHVFLFFWVPCGKSKKNHRDLKKNSPDSDPASSEPGVWKSLGDLEGKGTLTSRQGDLSEVEAKGRLLVVLRFFFGHTKSSFRDLFF